MSAEAPMPDVRREWLPAARRCPDRAFDAARHTWVGGKRGNPLCLYGITGRRCTFRSCPRRALRALGAPS